MILAASCKFVGSTNDCNAFENSDLCRLCKEQLFPFHWNGDNAYTLSESLMIPYAGNSVNVYQDSFNYYHSQCRIVVECLFGMFVARWGIFWHDLEFNLSHIVEIVHACLRLHNFCTRRNLPIIDTHYDIPEEFRRNDAGILINNEFRNVTADTGYDRCGSTLRETILENIQKKNYYVIGTNSYQYL